MFASTTLSVVFTVVFAVTGVYSLARLARLLAGVDTVGDRLVELFHLVMSLAMIGMAVAWTGGPDTAGGMLQVVVFGVFTVWFAYRAATRVTAHGHLANGYHLVMGAAMTWMVATMTLTMGPSGDTGTGGHQHGSAAETPEMSHMHGSVVAPGWVVVVSVVFVVLLLLAAGWWAVRAVRADDPVPEQDTVPGGAVATRMATVLTARTDAVCHVLMSLGMGGMLLAML